jgi:hypothetical protein
MTRDEHLAWPRRARSNISSAAISRRRSEFLKTETGSLKRPKSRGGRGERLSWRGGRLRGKAVAAPSRKP